jgi:hypothetical protein
MSKLPPKSPYSGAPEERRGTRTHKEYMAFSLPKEHPGGRTAALATRRQQKKALKLAYINQPTKYVKGRVIRACLRMVLADIGERCDDAYYGHP